MKVICLPSILFSLVYSLEVFSSLVLILSFSPELGLASRIVAVFCCLRVLKNGCWGFTTLLGGVAVLVVVQVGHVVRNTC